MEEVPPEVAQNSDGELLTKNFAFDLERSWIEGRKASMIFRKCLPGVEDRLTKRNDRLVKVFARLTTRQ